MSGFELCLVGGPERAAMAVGQVPVVIGRSPQADVVLADPRVSWAHARVWVQDGAPRVADQGSRNGTFVGGARVNGSVVAREGDEIDIAGVARFRISASEAGLRRAGLPVVEDVDTGVRYRVRGGRFRVSDTPGADLRVLGASEAALAFDGERWTLSTAEGTRVVAQDQPVELGDLRLIPRWMPVVPRSTVAEDGGRLLAYEVAVSLARCTAEVRGPGGDTLCVIRGDTGATAVFVLAQALAADEALPEPERGWIDDAEIVVRVWGRAAREAGLNRLKVTCHRLRHRLVGSGIDGGLVERAGGRTRLRAARVKLLP